MWSKCSFSIEGPLWDQNSVLTLMYTGLSSMSTLQCQLDLCALMTVFLSFYNLAKDKGEPAVCLCGVTAPYPYLPGANTAKFLCEWIIF